MEYRPKYAIKNYGGEQYLSGPLGDLWQGKLVDEILEIFENGTVLARNGDEFFITKSETDPSADYTYKEIKPFGPQKKTLARDKDGRMLIIDLEGKDTLNGTRFDEIPADIL